jgi:hypothetical protein
VYNYINFKINAPKAQNSKIMGTVPPDWSKVFIQDAKEVCVLSVLYKFKVFEWYKVLGQDEKSSCVIMCDVQV